MRWDGSLRFSLFRSHHGKENHCVIPGYIGVSIRKYGGSSTIRGVLPKYGGLACVQVIVFKAAAGCGKRQPQPVCLNLASSGGNLVIFYRVSPEYPLFKLWLQYWQTVGIYWGFLLLSPQSLRVDSRRLTVSQIWLKHFGDLDMIINQLGSQNSRRKFNWEGSCANKNVGEN